MKRFVILVGYLLLTVSASMASAQMMGLPGTSAAPENAVTLPDPMTQEAVHELVSRQSESEVRGLLLDLLGTMVEQQAAEEAQPSVLEFLSTAVDSIGGSIVAAVKVSPLLVQDQTASIVAFHENLGWSGIARFFGVLFGAMAIAYMVELYINGFMRRRFGGLQPSVSPDTLRETLRFLVIRLGIELLGLIAFFIVTRIIVTNMLTPEMLVFSSTLMINLVLVPRVGAALFRLILAPKVSQYRLLSVSDDQARRIFNYMVAILVAMGFMTAIVAFNQLNGVPMERSRLGFWLNLLIHLFLVFGIWRNWDGMVSMARGSEHEISRFEERVAKLYPVYAIVVVVLVWLLAQVLIGFGQFELLSTSPQFKSILVLTFLPVFDTLIRAFVRILTPPMTGEGVIATRAYGLAKRSYVRIGRVIVFGFLVVTVAKIWGLNATTIATAGVGAQFAGRFIEVLIVLAIGYLVWELVALWINRRLAAEQTALGFDLNDDEPGGGEGGGAGGSRLSTVLPLVHGIAKAAIIAIFGLIALGNLGIDTTPLLAGAGILGLAVGFGAQKLVGDIVSGMFFLLDDAFRTGEYVEVDGTMGTVEKISIRSMQLRHHRGLVHTIPFGEIPKLTNFSRDWVIMKLMFTVPFDTDPNKVKKIFKKIGNDMMAEDAWKDDFLQPFKSQGVFGFDDVGMVMRGKFMAKPGKQFMARKEIYNRVKAAFDEAGIDFARREVRVAIPGLESSDDLTPEAKAAIEATATDVAAQEQAKLDEATNGSKK